MLWATVTGIILLAGFVVARKRAPEIKEIEKTDSEMEMVLQLSQSSSFDIHIFFRRPWEEALTNPKDNEAYVTFYSPRQGIPHKMSGNHYRFPLKKTTLYQRIVAVLKVVEYEMPENQVTVHFGWPMSSWLDRLSIGVMMFNLMRLPRVFPKFHFNINHVSRVNAF
jgi:hypothetical protein